MTDPALRQIADAIEAYIAERHAANDGRTWTSEEAQAWLRLCVAHDAITQADTLLTAAALTGP